MALRETRARSWVVAGEYVDIGISGTKEKRPELDRLMGDAHRRRMDCILVWKFDRFARSVSHLLRTLETFKALGIEFVSFSEQLDTSTPAGKMVFTVLGAVAELERSLIVERVRAGLRNARARASVSDGPGFSLIAQRLPPCAPMGSPGQRSPNGWGWAKGRFTALPRHPPKRCWRPSLQLVVNKQPIELDSHPPEGNVFGRCPIRGVGLPDLRLIQEMHSQTAEA
jgi:hypothetical protein